MCVPLVTMATSAIPQAIELPPGRLLPNTRLKLAAPVVYGTIAFVHRTVWRRSLGAPR